MDLRTMYTLILLSCGRQLTLMTLTDLSSAAHHINQWIKKATQTNISSTVADPGLSWAGIVFSPKKSDDFVLHISVLNSTPLNLSLLPQTPFQCHPRQFTSPTSAPPYKNCFNKISLSLRGVHPNPTDPPLLGSAPVVVPWFNPRPCRCIWWHSHVIPVCLCLCPTELQSLYTFYLMVYTILNFQLPLTLCINNWNL